MADELSKGTAAPAGAAAATAPAQPRWENRVGTFAQPYGSTTNRLGTYYDYVQDGRHEPGYGFNMTAANKQWLLGYGIGGMPGLCSMGGHCMGGHGMGGFAIGSMNVMPGGYSMGEYRMGGIGGVPAAAMGLGYGGMGGMLADYGMGVPTSFGVRGSYRGGGFGASSQTAMGMSQPGVTS